eukprot:TRINITY_DN24112_c0_g1_i1.p1 TRINITY_DN24112_c0_g1~~TRINITY_DN24112_c0_g1_i1.p1  ORF type:complete len:579 (+),score=63.44 TRINITY_DN24112_c0_g1_i1:129-1865(+)
MARRHSHAQLSGTTGRWQPLIADGFVLEELRLSVRDPWGGWLDDEVRLAPTASLEVASDSWLNSAPPSAAVFARLSVVARFVDAAVGFEAPLGLRMLSACCTQFFTACTHVRAAAAAKQVARLEQALAFREHPDFAPADICLDDLPVDLEVAEDLATIDEEDLRALMSWRYPTAEIVTAVKALYFILFYGCSLRDSVRYTGEWSCDRLLLEPLTFLHHVKRGRRALPSRALRKLYEGFCSLHEHMPSRILATSNADNIAAGQVERPPFVRDAAAAITQWIFVQVLASELDAHIGALEKSLLLQPCLARRRTERLLENLQRRLERMRSDPLHHALLQCRLGRLQLQIRPLSVLDACDGEQSNVAMPPKATRSLVGASHATERHASESASVAASRSRCRSAPLGRSPNGRRLVVGEEAGHSGNEKEKKVTMLQALGFCSPSGASRRHPRSSAMIRSESEVRGATRRCLSAVQSAPLLAWERDSGQQKMCKTGTRMRPASSSAARSSRCRKNSRTGSTFVPEPVAAGLQSDVCANDSVSDVFVSGSRQKPCRFVALDGRPRSAPSPLRLPWSPSGMPFCLR